MSAAPQAPRSVNGGSIRAVTSNPHVRRLVACLFGGFVFALMYGKQEGSQNDFGISFAEATATPRLLEFLALGAVVFLLITFWSRIAPYVRQPGAVTLAVGLVLVLSAMALLHWYDPVGKFNALSNEVGNSSNVPWATDLFFSWFGWVLVLVCLVLGGFAVATRIAAVAWAQVVVALLAAALSFYAHEQLVSWDGRIDHSLGPWFALVGYAVMALAGLVVVRSPSAVADPSGGINRALDWRPGLPLVGGALAFGLVAYFDSAWFAPTAKNWDFSDTHVQFEGTGLPGFVSTYLAWLGPVLFLVLVVVTALACLRRDRRLAIACLVLDALMTLYTFIVLYHLAKTGAKLAPTYGQRWNNLGAGGWVACLAASLLTCGAAVGVVGHGVRRRRGARAVAAAASTSGRAGNPAMRVAVAAAVCFALFYPPTLPSNWQNVVVTQIAVYLLLAIGLNVVVGWAGLLDLGYIAFYGIGSYTTAYITGSLPVKPPSWLHLSPLWAIPFAVIACLIAGVLLGAPTLRLRGDYLAIVTLGFGEIIQVAANNNPGGLTGGPIGPNVPHPTLNLGFLKVTWGSPVGTDNLPYWYLLLALLVVALFFLSRIEHSRIGRAWAAIREDEVAAQATGVRTTRIKLLAFAIGASTSGIAGVFFASEVGYFDPTQFTLQNSILIVAYVVFGGMGSLPGALAGAAALTWLPYFLQSQVPLPDSQMWIGAIVLVMMIFRPAGLIPARRRAAELHGLDSPATAEVSAVPASEGL